MRKFLGVSSGIIFLFCNCVELVAPAVTTRNDESFPIVNSVVDLSQHPSSSQFSAVTILTNDPLLRKIVSRCESDDTDELPGLPNVGFVNIDPARYIGKWWNVQRSQPNSDWKCISYTYTPGNSTNELTLTDGRKVRGGHEGGPSRMILSNSEIGTKIRYAPNRDPYYVLATDYTNYSIEYEVNNSAVRIWVYSRSMVMEESTRKLVKDILARSKLQLFPVYGVDMSDCSGF